MKLFTRCLSILALGFASALAFAKPSPSTSVVYAMPHCDCCDGYVKYLQQHGVHVSEAITPHLVALAKQDGVPLKYREQPMGMTTGICHITKIGRIYGGRPCARQRHPPRAQRAAAYRRGDSPGHACRCARNEWHADRVAGRVCV